MLKWRGHSKMIWAIQAGLFLLFTHKAIYETLYEKSMLQQKLVVLTVICFFGAVLSYFISLMIEKNLDFIMGFKREFFSLSVPYQILLSLSFVTTSALFFTNVDPQQYRWFYLTILVFGFSLCFHFCYRLMLHLKSFQNLISDKKREKLNLVLLATEEDGPPPLPPEILNKSQVS